MSAEGLTAAPPALLRIVERTDLRVLLPALALTGAGLASLASTRPELVGTQLSGIAVGIAAALVLVLLPFRTVLAAAWPLWCLSVALLLAVLFGGVRVNGAVRWLRVGDVQVQPSEFAKVAQVLLLARFIRFRRDHRTFRGLFVPFALTLLPFLLVLREPDLGSALMLVPPLFAMLWAAGARTRHLLTVVAFGVASLPLVYFALEPYQQGRVQSFLHALGAPVPDSPGAPAARSAAGSFQVDRAEVAIAAGGLTGEGWGEGRMNLADRVPFDWTDFIFVVHAEEWGFAGTCALVLVYGLLFFSLASVAQECGEPAARLMGVGALATLGVQTCVNLMMTLRLAPVTGVPLPFLSYGRSSMLAAWLLVGLVLHAKAREPHVFTRRDFD